jgi:membrane-bound lytic murein transglycosylase B
MRVAPLDLIHPDIALEQFDYSRVGSRLAVVRLVTRMRTDIGLPADPRLVVDHGTTDAPQLFPARACRTEQRLHTADGSLLWRGAFAMPVELVEHPDAAFALHTGGELALTLPAPRLRAIEHRSLQVRPPLAPRPGVLAPGHVRRRAVALATAAALTATSTPAVALASSGDDAGPASTTPVGAPATTTATTTATTPAQAAPATDTTAAATDTTTVATDTAATTDATAATTTTAAPATPAITTGTTPTVPAPAPAATPPATTTTTPVPVTTTPAVPAAPTATVPVTPTTTTPTVPLIPKLPTTAPVMKVNGAGTQTSTGTTTSAGSQGTGTQSTGTQSGHGAERRGHGGDDGPGHRNSGNTPPAATTHHHAPEHSHRPAPTSSSPVTTKQARGRSRTAADRRLAILSAGVRQALAADLKAAQAQADQAKAAAPVPLTPTTSTPPTTAPGFTGPAGWTGTVSTDPTLTGAVRNLSALQAEGDRPPSFLIPIYMQAARKYHLPWQVLAAINSIESDYGRDLNTSSAGAVGWMQFEPSTWKQYGVAADGHSIADPYDPRDAVFSAARYLQAAGGSQDIRRAVFAYNHADWYVDEVMQRAQSIAEHAQFEKQTVARRGTVSVYFATGDKRQPHIRYRGSVMSHYDRLIASANMVSSANFPYLWGGGHESSQARFGPFDCSGAVSYVMQQAGYKVQTSVSGDIGSWNLPTGPGRVTIFYNTTHTFMRIGNRFFGTSGFARPGGGAGWFDVNKLPASYLDEFQEVHVPKLGVNSFSPKAMRFQLRHELALHLKRLNHLSATRAAQLTSELRTDRA